MSRSPIALTMTAAAAALLAVASAGCTNSTRSQDAVTLMSALAEDLTRSGLDTPLPQGVASFYEPSGHGQTQLHGSLYMKVSPTECVIVNVAVGEQWLKAGDPAAVQVSEPEVATSCPEGVRE